MKIVKIVITVVIVISFIMGLYCAGTGLTYDFKAHLLSIANVTEEMPHIEQLGYIWTADIITNDLDAFVWPQTAIVKYVNLNWDIKGFFAPQGIQGDTGRWYTFDVWFIWDNQDAQSYWEGWQPITDFIEGTAEIAGRVVYTFRWLGGYIVDFFQLVWALSPTSGIAER